MSRKQRRKKRRPEAHGRKQRHPQRSRQDPEKSVSWHWYVVVIVLALMLFAVFIATQFEPIDRLTMLGASTVCAGIAFLIIGTCTAVGNFDFDEDSWIGKSLGYLSLLAAPRRRSDDLFYPRYTLYVFFEKILIAVTLPLGFIVTFLRPKQTWPAILWVGSGLLAILGTYVAAVIHDWLSY